MAGSKETPRQKMIGMMYLVLTAMLALNVSSAVLDKFTIFNETLEGLAQQTTASNSKQVTAIQATVAEKGNRAADVKALKKAQEVRALTDEINAAMDGYKDAIIAEAGGRDETGNYKAPSDTEIVASMMLDPQKGKGKEFESSLDDYVAKLEQLTGRDFASLTLDAKDMEMFKNNPDQKNKDFLTLSFADAPMVAGLATISQLQTQILEYESDALGAIAEEVGAKDVEFTNIVPLIRPQSNVVAAGGKFEAELFITAAASGAKPTFKLDGKEVAKEVSENGIEYGKISFKATAGKYDSKTLLAEKTINATIELNDTTYTLPHTYYVAKPVVQVKSAALQALYQNCGNDLDIQVPALGTNYNPSFSSREAKVTKGSRKGLVTVVPQGRSKVKLNVSNDGSLLSTETFDVKKVPPPNIVIASRGKQIVGEVPAAQLSTISVKAEPDANFKREVPKDARYRVNKVTVKLARSGRAVKTQNFTKENIDLRSWRSSFRPGDALVINVERVSRRTFLGENERAKPNQEIFIISIK